MIGIQPRPFEYQRRIELHQRRASTDFGVGIFAGWNTATTDQRYLALREFIHLSQHARGKIKKRLA